MLKNNNELAVMFTYLTGFSPTVLINSEDQFFGIFVNNLNADVGSFFV